MDWQILVEKPDMLDVLALIVICLNLLLFVLILIHYRKIEQRDKEWNQKQRKSRIERALKSIRGDNDTPEKNNDTNTEHKNGRK
jgi:hypothetical protein